MATDVAVVIPWRDGCPHRRDALRWVTGRWAAEHPAWPVVIGTCPDGPWVKAAAVTDAMTHTSAEVVVVTDADVWCDGIPAAVNAADSHGWAVPHLLVHRLDRDATNALTAGLGDTGGRDQHPYAGYEGGGIVVLRRDAWQEAPLDPRFTGWGQEDEAWAIALRTLVGPPWRGTHDLIHLWHPPQDRLNRAVGSRDSIRLLRRYVDAHGDRAAMSALIEEATSAVEPARP